MPARPSSGSQWTREVASLVDGALPSGRVRDDGVFEGTRTLHLRSRCWDERPRGPLAGVQIVSREPADAAQQGEGDRTSPFLPPD